jgi:hypothetical protein
MIGDLVNLLWNKFPEATTETFVNLGNSSDFSDVTLTCADGQQVKAHKIILSSCSPLFRKILKQNPHSHPLIFLKGVDFTDLNSLVRFIYFGGVDIENERLERFLATADDLQVAGLTNVSTGNDASNETAKQEHISIESHMKLELDKDIEKQIDHKIDTIKSEHKDMSNQSNHTANGENTCDRCDLTFKSGKAWMKHRQELHAGQSFYCKECGKEYTTSANLKSHKMAIHKLIRQTCELCDSRFSNRSNLNGHKRRRHTVHPTNISDHTL